MSNNIGKRHKNRARPFLRRRRGSTGSQRVLQIVCDMAAAQAAHTESDPVEAMKNHSILLSGCKEMCARYHVPWRLVELRVLESFETRPQASISMCKRVMLNGRLPMHQGCKGKGCEGCLNTGLDCCRGDHNG